MEPRPDDPGERTYRWVIRTLYGVALALNAYMVWEGVKGSPEGERLSSKVEAMKAKALRPWHERKVFRRHANEVLFEALTVVEAAKAEGEPGDA